MRRNTRTRTLTQVAVLALAICNLACAEEWDSQEWDHQAHSKPGGPYYHVDWDNDGFEWITLDAAESHSHYFHHGPPPVTGVITEYHWISGASNKTLSKTKSPYIRGKFFLGITILKLSVTDQTGDVASGWTYIQVRKPHATENKPPAITSISPKEGPSTGGMSITIKGSNFYNNPKVTFSGLPVEFRVVNDKEIVAVSPKVSGTGNLYVSVTSGFGKSADIPFKVAEDIQAPIQFKHVNIGQRLKNGAVGAFNLPLVTCIKLGPDGRYYAGTRDGFIFKLALSRALVVEQWCKSKSVGKHRTVLGIAFHPHEWSTSRAYITTAALYWKKNKTGNWANGDVEVWTSVPSAECMEFSHRVVTGLPVSNHDHGPNAMEFMNNGDLLISVGGTTNAGVHFDGDGVGGIPESPLSAAIVIAKLSKGTAFDGKILYNQYANPGTATVTSGDVEVFAHGVRNVFGMTRHSNGKVYAMDNGPNPGYGKVATGCGVAGPKYGFKDKLLHIKKNAYYGHPNWNRARTDKRQCAWVQGDSKDLGWAYTAPMTTVQSSTNGIIEYTANTFDGRLRGELILSKLAWGKGGAMYRTKLNKLGTEVIGELEFFQQQSSLSIVQGPFGEVLMPMYVSNKLAAYVPIDHSHSALRIIAIHPRRGPAGGVNPVLITGSGFWEGVKVFFGGKECLTYKARTRESVWCQVPPGKPGSKVIVVAKHNGLVSQSTGNDYEYMGY